MPRKKSKTLKTKASREKTPRKSIKSIQSFKSIQSKKPKKQTTRRHRHAFRKRDKQHAVTVLKMDPVYVRLNPTYGETNPFPEPNPHDGWTWFFRPRGDPFFLRRLVGQSAQNHTSHRGWIETTGWIPDEMSNSAPHYTVGMNSQLSISQMIFQMASCSMRFSGSFNIGKCFKYCVSPKSSQSL